MSHEASTIELASIELPLEPSFWPLPIMSWLVLLAGFFVMSLPFIRAIKHRVILRENAKLTALNELLVIQKNRDVSQLNQLFRRIALTISPREEVAGLQGAAWLTWLDSQFDEPWLVENAYDWNLALYGKGTLSDAHWGQVVTHTKRWIKGMDWSRQC